VTRVGIIANPASGKDIRRLVAHASSFDNNEKVNIVRRVLLALDALGVACVSYMPDTYAIVPRAAEGTPLRLALEALPMAALGNAGDSREAARRLLELEAGALVTLGGDGTNRAVAGGCGSIPLVPISTGTNNVFPRMVEGTLAGLAAGLVATGAIASDAAVRRVPRLDVIVDGSPRDLALIDVVTSRRAFIGARALWDAAHVSEVVLSRVTASEIGLCALGGIAFPEAIGRDAGVHLKIGERGDPVLVPLGPGLLREIPVLEARLIAPRERIELDTDCPTVALDGECELEFPRRVQSLEVSFEPNGPMVVDIGAALEAGARNGCLAVKSSRHA
jgi:predicted polyphosphate/ATP-dependent NAD kinase